MKEFDLPKDIKKATVWLEKVVAERLKGGR